MFPWLFLFAPQWQLPFSGSVAQRIEPQTQWFFDAIDPRSGDGQIERQAFEVASYGRQLGLLTEVLLDLASEQPPRSAQAKESLHRLQAIRSEIERIKAGEPEALVSDIEQALERLHKHHPAAFERMAQQIQRRLAANP